MKPAKICRSAIRVRYAETDQMAVAHHSQYLLWLEVARTDFLREQGFRYRDLEARGILMSVIELGCRFRRPARYDDELTIVSWISELKRLKIRFDYEIWRGDELLGTASTTLGCIDREGKPRPLDADVMSALSQTLGRVSE
ncbi:MAG: acyl-CoA thioesterase [Bacteriovoracia bacterium]